MGNPYRLLLDRNILDILIGDTNLKSESEKRIAMPYLSGPMLCGISTQFGLPVSYPSGGGAMSRWAYLSDLIEHCIRTNKVRALLSFLFSKPQFKNTLSSVTSSEADRLYQETIALGVDCINGILYFNECRLTTINGSFEMLTLDSVAVASPQIESLDIADSNTYLKSMVARIQSEIEASNFDSAVTKSRTLLEETFCFAIEQAGEMPASSGKIRDLHNQVKAIYQMHQDAGVDNRVNGILSGIDKIVTSISEMRNIASDAHGVGASRISIHKHHARLVANSAITVSEFVLSVANRKQPLS